MTYDVDENRITSARSSASRSYDTHSLHSGSITSRMRKSENILGDATDRRHGYSELVHVSRWSACVPMHARVRCDCGSLPKVDSCLKGDGGAVLSSQPESAQAIPPRCDIGICLTYLIEIRLMMLILTSP